MDTPELFAAALGVAAPWYVARVDLAADQLTIAIDFRRGGRFPCPTCGAAGCPAHDTEERRWRHLNFFQYRTELVARVPRVACAQCGVHPGGGAVGAARERLHLELRGLCADPGGGDARRRDRAARRGARHPALAPRAAPRGRGPRPAR